MIDKLFEFVISMKKNCVD